MFVLLVPVTVEACVVMKRLLKFFMFALNKLLQLKTLEIEKHLYSLYICLIFKEGTFASSHLSQSV